MKRSHRREEEEEEDDDDDRSIGQTILRGEKKESRCLHSGRGSETQSPVGTPHGRAPPALHGPSVIVQPWRLA